MYGNFWKENTRLPIKKERIIVTGFPYFEKKINSIKVSHNKKSERKKILFISQLVVGSKISKFAKDFSELVDLKKYEIIYKLHPSEYNIWKEEYPWLLSDNIQVIDNNSRDIYSFLKDAYCQVGCFSTAIFEGLGLGVKAYVVDAYGVEYLEDLYENKEGFVSLVKRPSDILKDLENVRMDSDSMKNFIWKSDAIDNINRELKSILKKNK